MTELIVDQDLENTLEHFGVKGMRWGIRKDSPSGSHPSAGGSKVPLAPSEDHARVSAAQAKIKAGGTKTLSNKELQDVVTRMNLEQQYSRLNSQHQSTLTTGHNQVKKILGVAQTIQQVHSLMTGPLGKAIKVALETKK